MSEKDLQWHPAFYAGMQIELKDEAENLIFENEHQLGTKPFGIDVLIIKKESGKSIRKNIGRIFRKYNIVEYKSPDDYLSIDDFYKVYGYACFYKADVERVNSIEIGELTISLVCTHTPKKLLRHLRAERRYEIVKQGEGIYYVSGDVIPIQIIITRELSQKEKLWLRSLTTHMKDVEEAKQLLDQYQSHEKNILYQSVMEIVVRANQVKFQEVKGYMCEALKEIMKDEIDAAIAEGIEKKLAEEIEKVREEKDAELSKKDAEIETLKAALAKAQSGR